MYIIQSIGHIGNAMCRQKIIILIFLYIVGH